MKKRKNIEIEHIGLVFFILLVGFSASRILQSNYRSYHTEMHGAPVWGRIIRVDAPQIGKNGNVHLSEVEYRIGNDTFLSYTGELPKLYLNDSLIVIYDTTDVRQSFVILRNPHDAKSAFFKSQKDYMPLRWQQDYDKRFMELEKKRVAHRERKHFYDRFCRDD